MGAARKRRRWLLGLAILMAGLLFIWLLLPFWLPLLLRPLAQAAGANYDRYEGLGYTRFALHGVSFTNRTVTITANRMDALIPSVWLARLAWGRASTNPVVSVEAWELTVAPHGKSTPRTDTQIASTYGIVEDVMLILQEIKKYLPAARLSDGTVRVGDFVLTIPSAFWVTPRFQATAGHPKTGNTATIQVDLTQPSHYVLNCNSDSLHFNSVLDLTLNSTSLDLKAHGMWRQNPVELTATFGRENPLPSAAVLKVPEFTLRSKDLGLPVYEHIKGSISGRWDGARFQAGIHARSDSADPNHHLPPLQLNLEASGSTEQAMIESLTLTCSGAEARLRNTLQVFYQGELIREPAAIEVLADLGQMEATSLDGRVAGTLSFVPSENHLPTALFQLTASNAGRKELLAKTIEVIGALEWPWLTVSNAHAIFEDGSTVLVTGRTDLERRLVADGRISFQGTIARQWLPPGCHFQSMTLTGTFHGPLTNPIHSGNLDVAGFVSTNFLPLGLHISWTGQGSKLSDLWLRAEGDDAVLTTRGAITVDPRKLHIGLSELAIRHHDRELLRLGKPTAIDFERRAQSPSWSAEIAPVELLGPDARFHARGSLTWPDAGSFHLAATNLHSGIAAGFLHHHVTPVRVQEFSLIGGWTNGPAAFDARIHADVQTKPRFAFKSDLVGTSSGLAVSNLDLFFQTSKVASASGFLPFVLTPSTTNLAQLIPEGPLRLSATVQPDAGFASLLATNLGVVLVNPAASIELTGTGEAPEGRIALSANQIVPAKVVTNWPTIADFSTVLELGRAMARITTGHLTLQGEQVDFSAQTPLGETYWKNVLRHPVPDLGMATGSLRIESANIAPFAKLFPQFLSPQGKVRAQLSLQPGFNLNGAIAVENASTAPLPDIGAFRDLNLTLRFNRNAMELSDATATLGGAPLALGGGANLTGTNWLQTLNFPFFLTIQGTNVPLARRPELIVRSDLDLRIARTNIAAPVIQGSVNLRDSSFVSNFDDLLPGGVRNPRRRPPYFSIDTPPLSNWHLAVAVTGTDFLRVRSSVFTGHISTMLKLQGTLKEPLVLGDVTVDSGMVRFPFAGLRVTQGVVSLASENPFEPRVSISASTRQFGYDLRMEITGPASGPSVQFSSSPPLNPEQILLMITAGEIPSGSYAFTAEKRAQTLAVFLGRDLLTRLGVQDGGEQNLIVRSGEDISEAGRPTYHVEYRLSDRWSLIGEYDRFGDFNAGVKWRLYSK